MTLALKMADARYDGYEEGFDKGREHGLQAGLQQGLERGTYQTKLETAKNLLSMGLSPEQAAQGTLLPLDVVLELL